MPHTIPKEMGAKMKVIVFFINGEIDWAGQTFGVRLRVVTSEGNYTNPRPAQTSNNGDGKETNE